MDAGHVDDIFCIHKAVAGVGQHRRWVHVPSSQLGHDGAGRYLAVAVGHVAAFGHGGGDLNRVAQHMHIFGCSGFKGQVIHTAPAVVGLVVESGFDGYCARPHGRQHVQHSGFHVVLYVEFHGICLRID